MSAASMMVPAGVPSAGTVTALGVCFVSRTRAVKCVVTCGSAWLGSVRWPIKRQSAIKSSPCGWMTASTVTVRGSFR